MLNSCTVVSNYASAHVGGVSWCYVTNCIVYFNGQNSGGSRFAYSCMYAGAPWAPGNITNAPLLLSDGIHLTSSSPCRGAGTNLVTGTDIDGQPWANPPSIGSDEFSPAPIILSQPAVQLSNNSLGFTIGMLASGQNPLAYYWTKDGVPIQNDGHYLAAQTATLGFNTLLPTDLGTYQVVVSNAFGMVTSAVIQLQLMFHYVDAGGTNPVAPYSSWATAATNIQDAIDAALAGEVVLVTNGLYTTGGKVMAGDLTNRIALTKPLIVTSVNGPAATIIQGFQDPSTGTGPAAVRCAWLADGATLNGFTLRGGATRSSGDAYGLESGGGIWAASANAVLTGCVISNNWACYRGGGCYQGSLNRCLVIQNWAGGGGGTYQTMLRNSAVENNQASGTGGGVYYEPPGFGSGGTLINCTVTGNFAAVAGGMYNASAQNCIIFNNTAIGAGNNYFGSGVFSYTCTSPSPGGTGNISVDPQLLDGVHLKLTSPCRGAGSAAYASGTDVDGEAWASLPSMGCDEVWEAALNGPLSASVLPAWPLAIQGKSLALWGFITGRASRADWSFGDGSVQTNASTSVQYTWTNTGDYTVTFTAYNNDYPAGVTTSIVIHVDPLAAPTLSPGVGTGNNFTLSFFGQPGVFYYIDRATNLAPPVSWQNILVWRGTNGPLSVTDTLVTNAARFYRVRVP